MHQRKYFTLNSFINEIFSVEKFPNYSIFSEIIVFSEISEYFSLRKFLRYTVFECQIV